MLDQGPVDFLVYPLSKILNFPLDQIKFVLCLLFSYPLGYIYRILNSPFQKHVFTIVVGIGMIIFCFGVVGLIHFLATTGIMYIISMSIPSQYLPKLAFAFMFAYLSGLHIYRMVYDYMGYKLDATCVIMILVIKISILACNYRDGKRKKDESHLILRSTLQYTITEFPPLLHYYSYLCYFPTFLSGPAFHYSQYKAFIDSTQCIHPQFNPEGKPLKFPLMEVLQCFGGAIILAVLFVFVTGKYPMDIFFVEGGMDDMSLFSRFIYLFIGIFGVRCRYYFIWKLAEGAGIVTGLSFNGYDEAGKPKFDGLSNLDIWKIESCGSLRDITTYWNFKAGEWLKNYVYFRQTKNPNKDRIPSYALYLTNTASAFWHGFYPGYYLAFFYAALTTDIARQLRSTFRPMVTEKQENGEKKIYPKYILYDLCGRILTLMTFNYGFLTFVALSVSNSIIAYRNLAYSGHIVALFAYALLFVFNSYKKKLQMKPKELTEKKEL